MKVITEQMAASRSITIIDDDIETIAQKKNQIWQGIKDKVELPGFRKGHVPRSVAEKRSDLSHLYPDIVNSALQKGIQESGLTVCHIHSATIINWRDNQPLEIQAVVDVNPAVLSVDYKALSHKTSKIPEITDEQVEATIQRTRESLASYSACENDYQAQLGNLVTINFVGTIDGVAFDGGTAEQYQLKLGSHSTIDGFEDAIVGMKKNDTKQVQLEFPDNYNNANLAGKAVQFTISLQEVFRVSLPDIDDDMAKDAGYENLAIMRSTIKGDLEQTNKDNYSRFIQAQLLQRLVAEAKVEPIPESLIKRQVDNLLNEIMSRSNISDPESYFKQTGQKRSDFEFQCRPRAIEDIKAKLILEHIATQEGFVVSQQEREEYINIQAARMNTTTTQFQKLMSQESIDTNIRLQRANAFVADHAEIIYE
jgi:trigger factor